MLSGLVDLPPRTWLRAVPITLLAVVLIAVPTDLIDTPLFGRPVPVRSIDYAILAATAGLIGIIMAIRAPAVASSDADDRRTMWGGFASFLAVGCPVCNQLVVAAVGSAGALSWWAPVQPIVGLLAVLLLVWTLRRRLSTYSLIACPV
ncbi:MAG: hypothetical protein V3V01_20915 [Acidimicrobiales bacterium]